MSFIHISSPHTHAVTNTARVMQQVLLALVPGTLAMVYFFGAGTLVNIAWACIAALGCEALALKLRKRPIAFFLKDYSALVTAVLLALAIPPYAPWWVVLDPT